MRISDWSSDVCSSDLYCITSSRRSCSKSTSISGGSLRSAETKRENSRTYFLGTTEVMPRRKHTAELAAEPRTWPRMPGPRANFTLPGHVRKSQSDARRGREGGVDTRRYGWTRRKKKK